MGNQHVVEEAEVPLAPAFARQQPHLVSIRRLTVATGVRTRPEGLRLGAVAEWAGVKIVKHSRRSWGRKDAEGDGKCKDSASVWQEEFGSSCAHGCMNTHDTSSLAKGTLRRSMREALRAIPRETKVAWSSDIRLRLMDEDSWLPQAGGIVA